jgi:hypothetical protein
VIISIFEGCWHSFHKECLKDLAYCPLPLSVAANTSFVNGGSGNDSEQVSGSDTDDDMECDNLGVSTNESNIENMLNTINSIQSANIDFRRI